MRISNFRDFKEGGSVLEKWEHATVDVTTGFWFWKKTVPRAVHRKTGLDWRWFDDGKFVRRLKLHQLGKSHQANRDILNERTN